MKTIYCEMVLDQIPAGTSQMKRVNHKSGHFFEGKVLREARAIYTENLMRYAPEQPLEGPLYVRLDFHYAIKDKKKRGQPKTSRPDCDNLAKLILDVMTDLGYWHDDSQIAKLSISKQFSKAEHAFVFIEASDCWEVYP